MVLERGSHEKVVAPKVTYGVEIFRMKTDERDDLDEPVRRCLLSTCTVTRLKKPEPELWLKRHQVIERIGRF